MRYNPDNTKHITEKIPQDEKKMICINCRDRKAILQLCGHCYDKIRANERDLAIQKTREECDNPLFFSTKMKKSVADFSRVQAIREVFAEIERILKKDYGKLYMSKDMKNLKKKFGVD